MRTDREVSLALAACCALFWLILLPFAPPEEIIVLRVPGALVLAGKACGLLAMLVFCAHYVPLACDWLEDRLQAFLDGASE